MGMFHCDVCPMNFITESAVRRHLLCSHGRRFHRGRPSSLVPPKLLEAAVRWSRAAQANSRQRRRVCAVQQAPPVNAPPAADTGAGSHHGRLPLGVAKYPPAGREGGRNPARRFLEGRINLYGPPDVQRSRASGTPGTVGAWAAGVAQLVRRAAHHAVTRARTFRPIVSPSTSWRSRRT